MAQAPIENFIVPINFNTSAVWFACWFILHCRHQKPCVYKPLFPSSVLLLRLYTPLIYWVPSLLSWILFICRNCRVVPLGPQYIVSPKPDSSPSSLCYLIPLWKRVQWNVNIPSLEGASCDISEFCRILRRHEDLITGNSTSIF